MTRIEALKAHKNGCSITIINQRIVNKTGMSTGIPHVTNITSIKEEYWWLRKDGQIEIYNVILNKINNKIKRLTYCYGGRAVLKHSEVRSNNDTLEINKLVTLL